MAMYVFLFILLISFFVFMFVIVIISNKKEKEKKEREKNLPIKSNKNEFDTTEIHVRVVDLACTTRMVGVKYPKSIREYFVAFEKDDKSILKISVPEEFYDGFEIGQVGILTLVDGNVYSFIPDHYAKENKNETNN